MCNQIAVRLHIRPLGDEMYLHRLAHPITAEAGGAAAISGRDDHAARRRGRDVHAATRCAPRCATRATATSRARAWSRSSRRPTSAAAASGRWPRSRRCSRSPREHGLRTHLDGARLLNAAVASGESAAAYAAGFETAWIDFSKGLGAPIGACLAGSQELIDEAWRYKQMFGGSMRQAGIVAAGARYGLQHNVERLAEDHANAKFLAEGLAEIDGVEIDPATVETNIVIFDVADAAALHDRLKAAGVETSLLEGRVRMVTHLDVDRAGIETRPRRGRGRTLVTVRLHLTLDSGR